jgi:hypothetical protein
LVWKIEGKTIKLLMTPIAHCSIVARVFILCWRSFGLKIEGKAINLLMTAITNCSLAVIYSTYACCRHMEWGRRG